MQNNVTYLSQKLQRSLDNNYNVIDMPAVIEIISTLEKTSVTKELLETTRLGKYINELRRKTSNESLAKRAKELLKKWRDLILPDANGQIRSSSANSGITNTETRSDSPCTPKSSSKKRPASSTPPDTNRTSKKLLINGQNREYDFSDNSNCSVKELKKTDVIFINSDSNSSMPESINQGDHFEVSNDATDNTDASLGASSMQPKKRGRKKGSKNHKNLVIAAEESFTNKMAISRNSKVKTTQELLADIQNRKPTSQDIELRTAQLTESLSRIEHKLNPQKTINKNVTPVRSDSRLVHKSAPVTTSTTPPIAATTTTTTTTSTIPINEVCSERSNLEPISIASDDEIVDVVGTDTPGSLPQLKQEQNILSPSLPNTEPLTIENLLKQLPPIDKSCLDELNDMPLCECQTPKVTEINHQQLEQQLIQQQERITVQIVGASSSSLSPSSLTKNASITSPSSSPSKNKTQTESSLFAPISSPPSTLTFLSENTPSSDIDDERTSGNNDVFESVDKSDHYYEENLLCPAKLFLSNKYHLDSVDDKKVSELHEKFIPNVNGNFGASNIQEQQQQQQQLKDVDVENIVPNFMSERLNKTPNENFQKYSISINDCETDNHNHNINNNNNINRRNSCDSDSEIVRTDGVPQTEFREWHETLDVISYNDELLRILPYVIID